MAQSGQTAEVQSDAIRGSEILANQVKQGTSAVLFWLTIGIAVGAAVGAVCDEREVDEGDEHEVAALQVQGSRWAADSVNRLVHPDRHHGSPLASQMTAWLLSVRNRLQLTSVTS